MFRSTVVALLILAGTAVQCDAQWFCRLRARRVYSSYPIRCWQHVPACQVVHDPCAGTPRVTWRRFGIRAPFSYRYPRSYKPVAPTTTPEPKAPTPAALVEPTEDKTHVATPPAAELDKKTDTDAPPVPPVPVEPKKEVAADEKSGAASEMKREEPKPRESESEPLDIIQTAKKADTLSKLLELAENSGLLDEIRSGGKFTIFAPTDSAFEKMDEQMVQRLKDDKEYLREVLMHHAVQSEHSAEKLVEMTQVTPYSGADLKIEKTAEGVFVDGVRVETADIKCANGTIHILQGVLAPTKSSSADSPEEDASTKE